MKEEHPILCLFGDSVDGDFPLILVIGREPNADKPVTNFISTYDFRKAPRCAFWNTSYTVAGRAIGSDIYTLKQRCIQFNNSPIMFADALPQGILNQTGDKHLLRQALSPSAVEQHIDNLFSHDAIINRVCLVFASGIESDIFATARDAIEKHCTARNLLLAHVPFMYGTNTNKIMARLSESHKERLRQAFEQQMHASAIR